MPYTTRMQELPERARGGLLYKQYLAQQQQAMEPLLAHNRQHNILRATDALTWQAPVTHFDPLNNDTFSQRYYVDATYYKGSETDAPVFFMIGGESSLNGPPGGYMAKLAQEYGALLVALEHRYYGT